jgi:hypothetical protein
MEGWTGGLDGQATDSSTGAPSCRDVRSIGDDSR